MADMGLSFELSFRTRHTEGLQPSRPWHLRPEGDGGSGRGAPDIRQ